MSRPSRLYNNTNENISNWVLSDFSSNDRTEWLDILIENIGKNISLLLNHDLNKFLNNIK